MSDRPMRVLFCVSEAVPFAKTGGLADVAGALPPALAAQGVDVTLMLPRYRAVSADGFAPAGSVQVRVGDEPVAGTILEGRLPEREVRVWLVDQPRWFDRDGLYGEGGADYADNLARFTFFSRAVLGWVRDQPWQPDVIHCHDWQTALIPVLVAAEAAGAYRTVLTIHNLAYQGLFPPEQYPLTGLPPSLFTPAGLEFWGKVNLLKGGLLFADLLSTVSETYAQEIQREEFGAGLDGVLRERRADLVGILNGADYTQWDPRVDRHIPARYSADDLAGKAVCKAHLQRRLALRVDPAVPLIGMVTRLADQKGLDLVAAVIGDVLARGAQFALLGTGEPKYHAVFHDLAARHPGQVGVVLGFDETLAHQIEAGADLFLMPSRYEPSGLNQLYSLRYGTVPIVRRTGGLADSVTDATPAALADGTATGFVFDAYTPPALLQAIHRALAAFADPPTWRRLQQAGMRQDFSWSRAARRYVELYARALARSRRTA